MESLTEWTHVIIHEEYTIMVRTMMVYLCGQCPRFYDAIDACVQHETETHSLSSHTNHMPYTLSSHTNHMPYTLGVCTAQAIKPQLECTQQTLNHIDATFDADTEADPPSHSTPIKPALVRTTTRSTSPMRYSSPPKQMIRYRDITSQQCQFCDKVFTQGHWKVSMMDHINAAHVGIKYKCSICAWSTSYKCHLRKHMRKLHPKHEFNMSMDASMNTTVQQ